MSFLSPFRALLSLLMALGAAPTVGAKDVRPADVPEVPASLVAALSVPASAEGACRAAPTALFAQARDCTYEAAGERFTVKTANASAEGMARWIVDASQLVASVAALRTRDRAAWERALLVMAKHTVGQSSRTFPIDGVVWEDFDGPRGYVFHDGVTFGTFGGELASCRECACRPNSLHRSQWCTYEADVLQARTFDACMGDVGGEHGWNDAWARVCAANHAAAFESDFDASYRAFAYYIEVKQMGPLYPRPDAPPPDDVVSAFDTAFTRPYAAFPIAR